MSQKFRDDFFEGLFLMPRALELLTKLTEQETRDLLKYMGYSQAQIDRHYPATSQLTHEEEAALHARPVPDDGTLDKIEKIMEGMSAEERAAKMKEMIETEGLDPDFIKKMELTPEAAEMHQALVALARQVAKTEEDTSIDIPRDRLFHALKMKFDRRAAPREKILSVQEVISPEKIEERASEINRSILHRVDEYGAYIEQNYAQFVLYVQNHASEFEGMLTPETIRMGPPLPFLAIAIGGHAARLLAQEEFTNHARIPDDRIMDKLLETTRSLLNERSQSRH